MVVMFNVIRALLGDWNEKDWREERPRGVTRPTRGEVVQHVFRVDMDIAVQQNISFMINHSNSTISNSTNLLSFSIFLYCP